MRRIDELEMLIKENSIDQAIEMVKVPQDVYEAYWFVGVVLSQERSTQELIEISLKIFIDLKPSYPWSKANNGGGHGGWVHSVSHFIRYLWERRLDGWTKEFYRLSFEGANDIGDPVCSDRLIESFAKYSRYDDDPAVFHITPENIGWMKWDDGPYHQSVKARIERGPFESEEDLLYWKVEHPVNDVELLGTLQKLKNFGANMEEFLPLISKVKVRSEIQAEEYRVVGYAEKCAAKIAELLS